MDKRKKREIAALADTIRESLELRTPVDVVRAVERLGGKLNEVSDWEGIEEARIRRTGERFEIDIRKAHLAARKRFSVAHELGHLFLHMGYLISPETWGNSSEYRDSVYHRFGYGIEEAEANLFAAAFLMPEHEFRRAIGDLGTTGNVPIKQIADHFKTSVTAALRRGQELGVLRVSTNGG